MSLGELREVESAAELLAASAGASAPCDRGRADTQGRRGADRDGSRRTGQRAGGNCTSASGQRTLWTERAYPHRIVRWEDGDGGRGELIQTIRVPYWQLQAHADEVYRRELGIP